MRKGFLLAGAAIGAYLLFRDSEAPYEGPWQDKPVGKHFKLGEFVTWSLSRGPHRRPPPEVEAQITTLVREYLDPIREHLGRAVTVASGWRPVDLFPLSPGQRSAHAVGGGADIMVAGFSPADLARKLDQMAANGVIPHGGIGVYPPGFPMEDGTTRQKWDPTVHVDSGAHVTMYARRRWPGGWWA